MAKTMSRNELLERAAMVRAALTGYINGLTTPENRDQIITGLKDKLLEIAGKSGAVEGAVVEQLKVLAANKLINSHLKGRSLFYSGKKVSQEKTPRAYIKKEKVVEDNGMPHMDFVWDNKTRTVHVTTPDFTFTFGVKK